MNQEMIIKLVEAGYTKAEIEAMNDTQSKDVEETTEKEKQEEVKEEEKEKAATGLEDTSNMLDTINKQIEDFNKKLQSMNSAMAEMSKDTIQEKTASDIIASIVTPKGSKID